LLGWDSETEETVEQRERREVWSHFEQKYVTYSKYIRVSCGVSMFTLSFLEIYIATAWFRINTKNIQFQANNIYKYFIRKLSASISP
jgi:hypothetical protein